MCFLEFRAICERREPNGRSDSKLEQARSACGCEGVASRQCNAPPEKGTATALCPRRLLIFWHDSTAPPSRSHVSSSRAHRLSRLTAPRAARCRGAPRRRGRSGRVWELVFDRLAYKKPEAPMPCSSFGCRLTHRRSGGLPSDCSFGLRPRRTRLFCFTAR